MLWTCLHDEPYAYLDLFQPVFTGVAGLFFQTDPEHELATRICANLAAARDRRLRRRGARRRTTRDGFRARYGIDGPFLLYAGRREGAKGWEQMLECVRRAPTSGRRST